MDKFMLIMNADNFGKKEGFCYESGAIWQVVGYVLVVFKIVIPVILIVLGMIDLGKAVISGKDDEIKKNMKSLLMRAIAAVAIFFIPTLVSVVMGIVGSFKDDIKSDFDTCKTCLVNPSKCQYQKD